MNRLSVLLLFVIFSLTCRAQENSLSDVEKKLSQTYEEKVYLSVEKEEIEKQIKDVESHIKERKKLIIKRLRALYALRNYKWGDLFLDSNLNTLDRNIKILKNLNQYDYSLFKEYNSSLKQLALARRNLRGAEIQLRKNVYALKKQEKYFLELEKIQISSLRQAQKESLLLSKGLLSRPLDGPLIHAFGSVRDRNNQYYLINHGELYKTKPRSPVKSVGPGTIIFRDDLTGWHETIIIQHADNYYSVYAGVINPKKSVGEKVGQSDLLGESAGNEFYFELRHFDVPINPRSWYRR